MVPDADSMDFKVGELLKELRLDPSAIKAIDQAVSSIHDALNNIADQESCSQYATGFLRDLRLSSDKVNFTFKRPESIRIGGSHSIGCVAKPDINVDLLIRMPKECFHEKDYLNHRYYAKRCLYLCVIENNLKASPLVRNIEWRTLRNEARKPIIHLYPVIKHAELSEFFIRIIPTASGLFPASRLSISRNNVRAFNQGDTFRATPYYNSNILEDMFMEENADFVKHTFNGWKALGDALVLLKVWARNRTSIYTHDCLNGYLISIILSYLSAGSGGNHINKSMKAMQIFRATLKFISSNSWAKGLSLQTLVQSKEDMVHCLNTFPVVLYDATGYTNLLFFITSSAFAELQDEASWTIKCVDQCRGGGFEEVFLTKVDFAAKFDACLRINFKGNTIVNSYDICLDDERWRLAEKNVQSILQQGLSDRAKLIRATWKNTPLNWNIDEGYEKFGEESMLVGLLFSSEEKAFRVVDIGPHAENKEEGAKFRKFWGEKAELRRFRDGTIAESTVWECAPWQRHLIGKQIIKYVLSKHFLILQEDLVYVVDQLDFCLHLGGKDPISSSTKLLEAFENLSKRLRLLEDIPLRISSVQPLDPAFRNTAVFPPEPHPLLYEKGISHKIPKFISTCIKPLEVMIQLEGSGNWPSDVDVIEKTKTAFLLKICQSLRDRWGILCSATEKEVNVLMEGYAFNLKILHERSLQLSKDQKAENSTMKGKRYIDKELFFQSQHSSMINGLHGRYPMYGSVVRLAKRWVSSHLFSSFLEEEAIELIVAYLFLRPFPFHAPSSRITGFLRFLRLISNYDWAFSPLIIDINEDFTPLDEWEINEKFLSSRKSSEENARNMGPAMFLATTYDKASETWTKFSPNGQILRRMAAYARSSADLLTRLILKGQNGPFTWECLFRTPMTNYDAIVVLHRDKLSHPQHLLFPTTIINGKHVIQGNASREFDPIVELSGGVQSFEDARSKMLVNFDPTVFFLEDLKEEFHETFKIWYDSLGGDVVGLTWDSKKRKRGSDDEERWLIDKLKGVGELGKGFVKSVYLLNSPRLHS